MQNYLEAARNLMIHNDYGADFFRSGISEEDLNCTLPSILEFPNFMRRKSILYTVLCTLASLYLFIMLAIVCEDYLIPAMERLCYTLRMSYDVAGATFLAAATSAPELFVALVGTFITKGDIGIGTIVGSSVFNVLGIVAVCGILVNAVKLDWWPITRDTLWYLISIILLAVVVMDSYIALWEAIFLSCMYFLYLITLIFDRRIQGLCRKVDENLDMMNEDPLLREIDPLKSFREVVCGVPQKEDHCMKKVWWGIKYPAVLILAVTTPSARSIYFLTLLMAIVWISIISYFVTWFLTIIGHNLGIPDSIMGLVVIAIGSSVPEIVASYIVSKKGYGSMAICNAVGSNTFDIFICLGLPWLVMIIINREGIALNSSGILIIVIMLVITAILMYIAFLISRFVLGKFVGWLSLIAYIIFLIIATWLEMRVPRETCDIESKKYNYLLS